MTVAQAEPSMNVAHPSKKDLLKKLLSRCITLVTLIVIPSLYFGIAQYKLAGEYSLFDEATHIAYAWDVSHGHIPAKGDKIPQFILNDWSCEGQANIELPKCGTVSPADTYPALGENYNFIHPPIYYFITGSIARVLNTLSSLTFAQSARAISILWIVLGCTALYWVMRKWGIKKLYALSSVVLVPFIPGFFNSGTAVTNDAASILIGALLAWLAMRIIKFDDRRIYLSVVVTLIAGLTKGTFAFGFVGLAIVLGISAFFQIFIGTFHWKDKAFLYKIGHTLALGLTSIFTLLGWTFIQDHRGVENWINIIDSAATDPYVGSPITEILRTALSGFKVFNTEAMRGFDASLGYALWLPIVTIIFTCSAWLVLFMFKRTDAEFYFSLAAICTMLIYPTLVQIRQIMANGEIYLSLTSRYGLIALPLVVVTWAMVLNKKNSHIAAFTPALLGLVFSAISVTNLIPAVAP